MRINVSELNGEDVRELAALLVYCQKTVHVETQRSRSQPFAYVWLVVDE